ncbi:hypothetical protein CROQUDRAFT_653316 [Cronartium quercuum f. sp. fusiforme G11]|uniref:Uncharacterized protein n=1 Tax=Cronartium quercuum f. sp. fusiforme G11 TaxID=708437 RepID=A0A9P6TEN8_9BASI|nr:hypothetical protein CROQUDRAFT_653316 [Cronartium quercuum f. sp. fusiforme G11]
MKITVSLSVLLANVVSSVSSQGPIKIVDGSQLPRVLKTCVPVKISWTGGHSPYHAYYYQSSRVTESFPFEDLGEQKEQSFVWIPRREEGQPGQLVFIRINDTTGATGDTSSFYVQGEEICPES